MSTGTLSSHGKNPPRDKGRIPPGVGMTVRGMKRVLSLLALISVLAAACTTGPNAPRPAGSGDGTQDRPEEGGSPGRALVMVIRYEPIDLAPKIPGRASPIVTKRLFNAALSINDGSGPAARAYLAESLPQLNTETWRVFPDGRMETTYRLRPGLTWHDGQPLTADDFVFAWRVYTHRSLSVFPSSPQDLMEAVEALDPRVLVIRWRSPYPDAGSLAMEEFDPLPRHILGQPFASVESDPAAAETFVRHPYWTVDYVGAGPYRLERWDQGSYFEGVAFDGHALGRPKIDRITVRVMTDENTVLTSVLSENVHFTTDFTLRFEHARVLQREWAAANKGVVTLKQTAPVGLLMQQRADFVGHPGQLDVRVRRALAHSIDREAINEGVFEGQGFMTETIVPQSVAYASEVERAISKYAYDPRRTEQLMNEAGFAKDREGLFADAAGDRFHVDYRTFAGSEPERTQLIMTDTWKRAGIEVQPSVQPSVQIRDWQTAHTFPGMAAVGGGLGERMWTSVEIGAPGNQWAGNNRAGWSNAEYDRLYDAFMTTLDQAERTRQFIGMQRLLSEQLPLFIPYFGLQVNTNAIALQGPGPEFGGVGSFTPRTLVHWNIHEWRWQ